MTWPIRHLRYGLKAMLLALVVHTTAHGENAPSTEKLIEELIETQQPDFGYSGTVMGTQFLPLKDSGRWSVALGGGAAPAASEPMKQLVSLGPSSIPELVKHLDDARATKLPPVHGLMFIEWPDEYDYNKRTAKVDPKGVNRRHEMGDHPREHALTVGDLCFVALGQIVNREFNATRYQPSGGVVINSPTASPALLATIRQEYADMTPLKHKEKLLEDFTKFDSTDRVIGAARRIAFYYPDEYEALVLQRLKLRAYDLNRVRNFIHDQLYKEPSPLKRAELIQAHAEKFGASEKDGIVLWLFEDFHDQLRDERYPNLEPVLRGNDARNVLQLFGFPQTVQEKDRPYPDAWCTSEKASFIASLPLPPSPAIAAEVFRIFSEMETDDDDMALSCMRILAGKDSAHDAAFAAYCQRRIGKSEYWSDALREMSSRLAK